MNVGAVRNPEMEVRAGRLRRHAVVAIGLWALLAGAAPPVAFVPAGPRFGPAADEYRALWEMEGSAIAAAMESATGFSFPQASVEAIVSETPPMTAFHGREMRLRASYSPAYKRATLVHEMGHLLALSLPRTAGVDDHRLLYLFLYDVWSDLYGRDFADHMVRIERRIGSQYDAAWGWALAMTREERQARLRALRTRLEYERIDLTTASVRRPFRASPTPPGSLSPALRDG
jgi:hypothetical protein